MSTTAKKPLPRWVNIAVIVVIVAAVAVGGWLIYSNVKGVEHLKDPAPMPGTDWSVGPTGQRHHDDSGHADAPDHSKIRTKKAANGSHRAAPQPETETEKVSDRQQTQKMGPNRLRIPSLGIDTTVRHTGLDSTGALILPDVMQVTQWKDGAKLDAEKGTTLIAGHVDSATKSRGAMWPLHQIRPDAAIFVTDSDGKRFEFKAAQLTSAYKSALPDQLFDRDGDHRLAIVTCGGPLVKTPTGYHYESNVIVYADPVGGSR